MEGISFMLRPECAPRCSPAVVVGVRPCDSVEVEFRGYV